MQIKFLGTSAAWPLPRLNCHCSLCSSEDPRDKRKRSSALVSGKLLLDAGYDIYEQIKSEDLTNLRAVAITHEHPDHTAGLPDLDHIYNQEQPIELFVHKKTWNKFGRIFQWKRAINFIEPFEKYKVADLEFRFLPVIHTDSAFGIEVQEARKKFFYTPDMKNLPTETRKEIQGEDLVAFDGSSAGSKGSSKGHQTMEAGVKLAKELGFKETYFTHIGHLTQPYEQQERALQKLVNQTIHLTYDGLTVQL